jgi:DNA modification methylase
VSCEVIESDVLAALRAMPDASFDGCLCDPPYGLGSRKPTVEEIVTYLTGATSLNTGGDFMGKKWELPSVAMWRELYRVLRPGAHALIFGGTRTFDLLTVGLRAAGFEIRDVLSWMYGSGFRKSIDISKSIDDAAGAKRLIGPATNEQTSTKDGFVSSSR